MPDAPKRPWCAECLRPQSACICRWMVPVAHTVEVLILQHPMEVAHTKGSARLLHGCLRHSRIVAGEAFDTATLQNLLTAPWATSDEKGRGQEQGQMHTQPRHAVLLYPDTPHNTAPDLAGQAAAPRVLPPEWLAQPAQLRLVVLDGSWRKSRKMLYANPLLQALPRIGLQNLPPSRYALRKAHRPDQLSTLEATCSALAQLEGNAEKFQPVLSAFDGFVAQQLAYQPDRQIGQTSKPDASATLAWRGSGD